MGTNADQPPNWHFEKRDPTAYDINGVSVGDFWLNSTTLDIWVLASLKGDTDTLGASAHWIAWGDGGGILSITTPDTVVVYGDDDENVNFTTAITNLSITGDDTSHAVDFALSSGTTALAATITTEDDVVVPPDDAGNWNIVGDGDVIETTGDATTHTITIAATGSLAGFTWQQVTDAAVTLVKANGYIANNSTQTVFTLPTAAAIGDTFAVTGINNATGWKIAQNASQTIHINEISTTTGTGGYLESTAIYDAVWLTCIETNTDFVVWGLSGNITYV